MPDPEDRDRFAVIPPTTGTLRIASDVMVRYAGNEWIAISHEPAVEGETAQLGFRSAESLVSFDVTVLESHPTIVGNVVRHRLRLGMPASVVTGTVATAVDEKLQRSWATGVLTRDHEVRLLAFSTLGCALESDWSFRSRTRGHLRVSFGGVDFVDSVEIVVSHPYGTGSVCELGVRFGVKDSVSELSHPYPQAERLEAFVRSLTTSNVH